MYKLIDELQLNIGDIIFQDTDKFFVKILKYLMRSPSIWHDLFRIITGKIKKCEYYHPVVVISHNKTAEQQKIVQYDDLIDELNYDKFIIVRRKDNLIADELNLTNLIEEELGQPWGYLNVLGKFLTWLTNIKLFGRYIKRKNEEVSALRIARWYYKVFGETFGEKDYRDNTTQTMVQYVLNNPDKYNVIYKKG